MTDSPMDFFGHRETKEKQKIVALSAPIAQEIDDLPLSEGYSASEAFDDSEEKQRQDVVEVQAWEDAGLEHYAETSEQGGGVSLRRHRSQMFEDMEIPCVPTSILLQFLSPVKEQSLKGWMMIQFASRRSKLRRLRAV